MKRFNSMPHPKVLPLAALVVFLGLLLPVAVSQAANLTVNNTTDASGTGSCSPSSTTAPCSLRQALTWANSNAGDDTITFSPTVFATQQTITITTPLTASSNITITGPASKVTISGGSGQTFDGLDITGGNFSASKLGFKNFNYATASTSTGPVSFTESEFSNSVDGFRGDSAGGSVAMTNCRFSDDTVGAAFFNPASTIQGCLFDGSSNAGLALWGTAATVTNSTMYGNLYGIGIGAEGTYTIKNVTAAENPTGFLQQHGTCFLSGSIVTGNIDIEGGTLNAVDGLTLGSASDFGLETNNGVAVLKDNGGPTLTVALIPGSPEIDAAGDTGLTTDQRGVTRPQGLADDKGAYEYVVNSTPSVTITSPTPSQRIPLANWTNSFVTGTASAGTGVSAVKVKLFKTTSGVKSFWNGTTFVATSTELSASLVSPGAASTNWTLTNGPTAAQIGAGNFTVIASAVNAQGVVSTAVTNNFALVAESVPPVVTVVFPTSSAVLTPTQFAAGTVNGAATDNAKVASISVKLYRTISGVKSYWDGTQFSATSTTAPITTSGLGTSSAVWSLSAKPSVALTLVGSYGVSVTALDDSGNQTVFTQPFTIAQDSTPPVVTISTPNANQVIQASAFGPTTLTGHATDDVAVASVPIKLFRTIAGVKSFWDGSQFGTASVSLNATLTGSDPKNLTWNLSNVPSAAQLLAGSYSVQVGAKDTSGNVAVFVTRNFTIAAAPSIRLPVDSSANSF